MDPDKRTFELEGLTLLLGNATVHFTGATTLQEVKDLHDFFWTFLFETAHWVISPSQIQVSKSEILLKLWLDRVDFIAKWVESSFGLYDYKSANLKFQELRIIIDPLEILESSTLIFINNRNVELVHLRFFSLLRILNQTRGNEDLIIMFQSNITAFMIAAVDSIENDKDVTEIDEATLLQIAMSWLSSIINNSEEEYRKHSWKVFQKLVKKLDNNQIEAVIIEMLDAPVTSIITAGLKLLKDFITDKRINSEFLELVLRDFLLNLESNLYKDSESSILNDNDLFKERIGVISHVVNLCKFLKMKSNQEFTTLYSKHVVKYGKQILKTSQNFIDKNLECNLLLFTLNELLN